MPNLADLKVEENIVLMAVGEGGSGKTTALASFPKPIFIFDIDHRIKGLLGSDILTKEDLAQIDYVQPNTKDGFKSVDDKFYEFSVAYDKRQLKYKTIIVESADQLFEVLLEDSFRQKTKQGDKPIQAIPEAQRRGTNILGQINLATIDDYKYVYAGFRKIFYDYFKYFHKCNIILSAGTTPIWGPREGETNKYAADIITGRRVYAPQGLADLLPRMFDEIWEFTKIETGMAKTPLEYKVQFRNKLAKTCIKQLPNEVSITNKNFYNEIKSFLPIPNVIEKGA